MNLSEEIIDLPLDAEFYSQTDSVYMRIQFISDLGFKISIKNELLLSQDADTKSGEFIGAIARGLLEYAYGMGEEVYRTGKRASFQDMLVASSENLTDEQKDVWLGLAPSGSIN